jgi:hypothetical protein
VLLGLLAVFVGLWDKLPSDAFFNFPANSPFPHLTINDIPLLAILIELWVGYGVCMFFYFSVDWFPGKLWWSYLRHLAHGFGLSLIGMLLIIAYFFGMAEISFFLPEWIQGPYWFIVAGLLLGLTFWIGESAFRTKGLLRNLIVEWLRLIGDLGKEIASALSEALENHKKKNRAKQSAIQSGESS